MITSAQCIWWKWLWFWVHHVWWAALGAELTECASDRNPGQSSSLCGPLDVVIVPVYIQYTTTEGHLLILFYLKHGEFQLKVSWKWVFLGSRNRLIHSIISYWENKIKFNNHKNLPNSLRCLIVGSSGCGKTCLLLKMLLIPNFLDYDNLIIFTKLSFQPEYQLLTRFWCWSLKWRYNRFI